MLINEQDKHLIEGKRWRIESNGYVVHAYKHEGKSKRIYLHRLIMNAKPGELVDHINGNRSDNRRENLRIASYALNRVNTNKTKGCYFHKFSQKWVGVIRVKAKTIHLGSFKTEREATFSYKLALKEYYGIHQL